MLSRLISLQDPSLDVRKIVIIENNADDQLKLLKIEDKMLMSLRDSSPSLSDFLKDETCINELQNSNRSFSEINNRI